MSDTRITPTCPVWMAFGTIFSLIALLALNVGMFGDDASYGPNQLALLFVGISVIGLGVFYFHKTYKEIESDIVDSISATIPACFILLMVGPLISLWILGGIVPGLIYYGLELINPRVFLPVTCLACALVSISIGSSWSTMGTVGVALMGIGQALGVSPGLTAGAIISGAYFGDKMSPLSDTTNLAPAIAGTDLFTHIKYLTYSTVPAILMALIIFSIISLTGFSQEDISTQSIVDMQTVLRENFHISPLIFIAPLIVLALVAKKFPPLPSLFLGCIAGIFSAIFLQKELLLGLGADGTFSLYSIIVTVAHAGTQLNLDHEQLDGLLSRGGMYGMLPTVWLILSAMFFGGALESTGMLKKLAEGFLYFVRGTGSLVGATIAACLTLNMTASDQYLAIVVPGKMFKKNFDEHDLAPENLSRSLEDGGTMTSVLIPWNTCGAYASGVLGVSTLSYAAYCFFNILSPITSIFLASMQLAIKKKLTNNVSN